MALLISDADKDYHEVLDDATDSVKRKIIGALVCILWQSCICTIWPLASLTSKVMPSLQ